MGEIIETGYKATNILNYTTWVSGTTGTQTGFACNGATAENYIIDSSDPSGKTVPIWEARSTGGNDKSGGWNTTNFIIDNTKLYRFTTWVKRTVLGNRHFYLGCHGYGTTDGVYDRFDGKSLITNPYFMNGAWGFSLNKWHLIVGYIWPYDAGAGAMHEDSGIYTVDGGKVASIIRDFIWHPTSTTANQRSYLYYSTDTTTRQSFVYPRVDIVDGTEPSLDDLIAGYDSYTFDYQDSLDGGSPTIPMKISNESIEVNLLSEMGVTDGMVGYWPLDNDTDDYSGSNIIETPVDISYTSGIKNSAGSFNGTTSQITFSSDTFRNDSFTMSIWFNSSGALQTGACGLISITYGVTLYLSNNGTYLYFRTYDTAMETLSFGGSFHDSTWHNAVATLDSNGTKCLYFDGNLVASGTHYNNWNWTYIGAIGYDVNSPNNHFYGALDEALICERALSSREVMINYEYIKEKKLKMTNSTIYSRGIIEE